MQDNFEIMWKDQAEFNKKLMKQELTPKEKQDWTNFYCLALHREVSEFLNETNWKVHRKHDKEEIQSNKLEELVDVLKYFMCLAQVNGFTAQDVVEEYFRKSQVVEQRHYQEIRMNLEGKKIVGVDIDGILADYPASLVDFTNRLLGTEFQMKNIKSYDIFSCMGIQYDEGRRIRHLYRESGEKRFINVCDGAKHFLQTLKDLGYVVVLLTARPYQKYKRIFADTQYWLTSNEMPYDAILWDEDKGERLVKEFGAEKIEFFIDDVAKYANGISDMGIKCFLMNKSYNDGITTGCHVARVDSFEPAIQYAKERAKNG